MTNGVLASLSLSFFLLMIVSDYGLHHLEKLRALGKTFLSLSGLTVGSFLATIVAAIATRFVP